MIHFRDGASGSHYQQTIFLFPPEQCLLLDRFIAILHEKADGSGCCVELGHLVLVNDTPHAANIWVNGEPFKLSRRHSH